MEGNDLRHLPDSHLLRASTALTSLWHAVEICTINSIEAGSSEVHVEVDTTAFSFKIVDNGHGRSAADLKLLGTTWNISSKNNNSTQHVGIGLASICSTALVEITSRAAGSFETHSCLLRAGELVQLKLAEQQKPRSGTTIIARDMFFNRPITRKALANERSTKEVEKCRDILTGLALLYPNITFTLHDKSIRSFILKHLKGRSQLQMVSGFFGNPFNSLENVAQLDKSSNLAENNSRELWRVSGWAVRPPLGHPTPSRQRIFVNNRAVKAPLLATTIDELFAELYKAILKHEAPGRGELLSIRKANNQHSMFVLSLFCPPELVEILPEAGDGTVLVEDWIPVQEAVRQAILTAWNPVLTTALLNEQETEMARSLHAAPVCSHNALQYPGCYNNNTSARRSLSNNRPGTSHNTREMLPLIRLPAQRSLSTGSEMMKKSTANIVISNATTLPSLLLQPKPSLDSASNQHQQQHQSTLMASWRQRRELSRYHPASGAAGVSVMDIPPSKRPRRRSTGIHSSSVSQGSGSQVETKTPGSYSALDAILSSWKNPALMPDTAAGKSQDILSLEGLSSAVFARLRPEALEREHLRGARALHQVDSKFVPIVCSNGILALLDQHAADERVQLEKLRAQIIAPTGGPVNGAGHYMELPTPQPLRLGADEVPLLESFGHVVWQWGWRWVTYPAPAAPEMLVEVTAVPLIAQRALTATDMRIYLHDLAATNGGAGPPSGLIRVLNSKACRTAIMFGDELLPVQCQDLVDNLQTTQMCFICAHGRPTTAPVVDLVAVGKAAAVLQATVGAKKKGNSHNSRGKRLSGLKDKLVAALNE